MRKCQRGILLNIGFNHIPVQLPMEFIGREDHHQVRNARQLSGGVRIVEEQDLDHARCEDLVRFLGEDGREERERMRHHLRAAVPADAASRVWAELDGLAHAN